jgi:hypothetical protein
MISIVSKFIMRIGTILSLYDISYQAFLNESVINSYHDADSDNDSDSDSDSDSDGISRRHNLQLLNPVEEGANAEAEATVAIAITAENFILD